MQVRAILKFRPSCLCPASRIEWERIWPLSSVLRLFKGLQPDSKCYDTIKIGSLFQSPKKDRMEVCPSGYRYRYIQRLVARFREKRWNGSCLLSFYLTQTSVGFMLRDLLIDESQVSVYVTDLRLCTGSIQPPTHGGRKLRSQSAEHPYLYKV